MRGLLGVAWLGTVWLAIHAATANEPLAASELEPATWPMSVDERAGIRRFSYPVQAIIELPREKAATGGFRLMYEGKPVRAQFSRLRSHDDRITRIAIDFNVSMMPNEKRDYVLEFGDSVPEEQLEGRMKVEESGARFRVVHSPGLQYTVPRSLLGLLESVTTNRGEFLQPDSRGLIVRMHDESEIRLGEGKTLREAKVVYQGPFACQLELQHELSTAESEKVKSIVRMHFPGSKSWVRIDWTVNDPHGSVRELVAELNLAVANQPVLVDFGAGSYVYTKLRADEAAELRTGGYSKTASCEVLRGKRGRLEPFVLTRSRFGNDIGWAHLMDEKRSTAIAVSKPKRWNGRLAITGRGNVTLARRRPAGRTASLTFWYHFVSSPIQIGALTSAQSMQSPLHVTTPPVLD